MIQLAIIHEALVVGGAEKSLINLLHFIDYDQYEVTLWVRDGQGELLSQVDSHVKVKFWKAYLEQDYRTFLLRILKKGRLLSAAYSVLCRGLSKLFVHDWHTNYKFYIKSLLFADTTNYDVAISYHSLIRSDLMFLDYAIKAKKKIGWIHGACRHDHVNSYYKPFALEYPKLDHIFCVSNANRRIFLDRYPALEDKTSVMYNLQNTDEILELSCEPVAESFEMLTFVTVGRLAPEKGQDMIPAIAEKLLGRGYRFIWYLIGDGPMREALERDIIRRNLSDTVILLGQKNNPYPYIKNCSVYVQPSYSEGFCLTTFEAKILKKVQVVTKVPGMSEQFSQQEAVFCEPEVTSLTDGIEMAINKHTQLCSALVAIPEHFNQTELKKLYSVIED